MKLLRNPEIKKNLFLFAVISFAASFGAFVWEKEFGIYTFLLCLVFISLYLIIMRDRYYNISQLADCIDRVLHGEDGISFDTYAEGELGVLQSELYKMTVRLREQHQRLRDDKIYLADSLADISHQIRTPLTSINLLVSFLSEPGISDERRLSLAREMYELLSRIDWLITSLLKISRLDAGTVEFKRENVSLGELIDKSVSPLLVPAELKGIEIATDVSGSFSGDIAWTAEAIGNIIKNCIEHTPRGGMIEIKGIETALYFEVRISDNGCGISPCDLPHVFERFYKGKNSDDKSFGIGLALARMITAGQNGTLKAENLSPCGAAFTMRFYKSTV